jgi:hypothetical protein
MSPTASRSWSTTARCRRDLPGLAIAARAARRVWHEVNRATTRPVWLGSSGQHARRLLHPAGDRQFKHPQIADLVAAARATSSSATG